MNDFTRITVPLSRDEFLALRDAAGMEYRHPREHARWMLRQALGLDTPANPTNANRVATDSEAQRDAIARK